MRAITYLTQLNFWRFKAMKKLILGCFVAMTTVAIASTISPMSVEGQTTDQYAGEYIDSSIPQVIEKIDGNIVTFKDVSGISNNYYVPDWMFSTYNLKTGSSMNLYNRNVIQGFYRDTYIDTVSQGLPPNMRAFKIHESRRNCSLALSPASAGIGGGSRVWYKPVCCPSTIPVVGAMWSSQRREIASVQTVIPKIVAVPAIPLAPYIAPVIKEQPPVRALW